MNGRRLTGPVAQSGHVKGAAPERRWWLWWGRGVEVAAAAGVDGTGELPTAGGAERSHDARVHDGPFLALARRRSPYDVGL